MAKQSTESRLEEVEQAIMLYVSLAVGEPPDATDEEKASMAARLEELLQKFQQRLVKKFEHQLGVVGQV